MPKSKEVLSSTSGSDSDSDVDTKVCVILIHLLFIYYQDCQIQFISRPMKVMFILIKYASSMFLLLVMERNYYGNRTLGNLLVLIKLSDIDHIFDEIIQN